MGHTLFTQSTIQANNTSVSMRSRRQFLQTCATLGVVGTTASAGCLGTAHRAPNPSTEALRHPDMKPLAIQQPPERDDGRVAVRAKNTGISGPVQFRFYYAVSSSEWVSDFSGHPETLITEYGFVDGPDLKRTIQAGETITVIPADRAPDDLQGTQVLTAPMLVRVKVKNVGFAGDVQVHLLNGSDSQPLDSQTVTMAEDSTTWVSFDGVHESAIGSGQLRATAETLSGPGK